MVMKLEGYRVMGSRQFEWRAARRVVSRTALGFPRLLLDTFFLHFATKKHLPAVGRLEVTVPYGRPAYP